VGLTYWLMQEEKKEEKEGVRPQRGKGDAESKKYLKQPGAGTNRA